MPLYSYECARCDDIFNVTHSMKEVLKICPGCEAEGGLTKLVSVISNPSILPVKVGDIVKEAIKSAHGDIKVEMEEHRREKQ